MVKVMMFLLLYPLLCKSLFSLLFYFLFLYTFNHLTQTKCHESPYWGSSYMAWNMAEKRYKTNSRKRRNILVQIKVRCVSKWNPQKGVNLVIQAAVCLITWMSADSMYADSQVTWFWQNLAVTLLPLSWARSWTEAVSWVNVCYHSQERQSLDPDGGGVQGVGLRECKGFSSPPVF